MDDDSIVNFELLETLLEANDDETLNSAVLCPSLTRNSRVWRYQESKVMGKYAHSRDVVPERVHPDFCIGYLYTVSRSTGLALAEVAKFLGDEVKPDKIAEDVVVTGHLLKRLPWLYLKSLTPIGGSLWDSFFSHCPILSLLLVSFNQLVLDAGSSDAPDMSYVHNPKFLICAIAEGIVYEYLLPIGIPINRLWQGCSRNKND